MWNRHFLFHDFAIGATIGGAIGKEKLWTKSSTNLLGYKVEAGGPAVTLQVSDLLGTYDTGYEVGLMLWADQYGPDRKILRSLIPVMAHECARRGYVVMVHDEHRTHVYKGPSYLTGQ